MAVKDETVESIKNSGMDVGVVDDSNGKPPVSPDHNDGGVTFNKDDISKKTKKTLKEYVKQITSLHNVYPVHNKYGAENSEETTLQNKSSAHIISQDSNEKQFVDLKDFKNITSVYYENYNGDSNDISSLNQVLNKGKGNKKFDGHTILPTESGLGYVRALYTEPLTKQNRFSSDTSYVKDDFRANEEKNIDISYENKTKNNELKTVAKELEKSKLGKIGRTLMMRATGKVTSNDSDFDPDNIVNSSLSVVPGTSQLFPSQNINVRDLSVKSIIEALTGEKVGQDFQGADSKSWGNLNNYNEPFDGITSVGMNALSVALLLAVDASIRILDQLLNIFVDKPKYPYNSSGIHFKGHFRGNNEQHDFFSEFKNVNVLLGLKETTYSYFESLDKGIKLFFGDKSSDIASNIRSNTANAFEKTKDSPGFYIILCRAILRSGYGVGNKIAEISTGNPLSFVQSSFTIIKDLKRSKIISACNMFATIGDTAYKEEDFINSNINDSNINDVASPQYKIRHNKSKTLRYRSSSAPSLYILPKNYLNFASSNRKLGQSKTLLWDSSATYHESGIKEDISATSNIYKTENNKIPHEFVKRFENYLEAEYVPFYFQDSRTNEIISFHAFLSNLTEDYSPQWENMDNVFGRVDSVKIYKSTQRKISLTFTVMATDTNDFDSMWYKINKIITLVYPQWSKGKVLETDKKVNFTQPFSQIIASSPIIRLRIGDLIKSNYSKFALLRMFNTGNSTVESKDSKKIVVSTVNILTKVINKFYTGECSLYEYEKLKNASNSNILKTIIKSNSIVVLNPTSELSEKTNTNVAKNSNLSANIKGTNTNINKTKNNRIVTTNSDLKVSSIKEITKNVAIVEISDEYFSKTYGTSTIGVPLNTCINFSFSNDNWTGYIKEENVDATANQNNNEFLDKENNSLMKFFEDNTFKGLPGVIESLNFKWLDNSILWETASPGSKAPMSCEVSIGFSVIHDISPGLDYSGFNRAPVYNVGKQMNAVVDYDDKNTEYQSTDRLKK